MNHSPREDGQLVEAFCAGDNNALESLILRHGASIYSYVLHMLQNEEAAEEIFQAVFIRVFKRLKIDRDGCSFREQIFALAHNMAAAYRERHVEAAAVIRVPPNTAKPACGKSCAAADRHLPGDILNQWLYCLPFEEREIVLLREYSGLNFREIAEITDTPIGTVLARMHKAVARLHGFMPGKK